ncbi:Protein CBG27700 [Caenorhabditis briggsae]|uniref:Protein CBG27700 n=1 Tax=Caenorhabditis briggsae TaxID=6238 RepID=B6IJE5_CAEBR|nr:Protein CBG27700 [Caenorhabditis briggsae]CAR99979.1 Protein CBG27700 [Caenorhabditis briggsae]
MDPPLPPQTVVKMEPPTTEDKAKDQSPPDATKVESQIENPEIFQIAFKFYCIATFPLLIMSTLSSSPDCEPQMHICINELGEIALYVQMIVITVIHFLMFLFCLVEVKRCLILLEYIGPKDDYSMDPCESYYSEYEASNNASPTKQDLPQIVIAA